MVANSQGDDAGLGRDAGRAELGAAQSVALETVVFSGRRYVAPVDLGVQQAVPLMVHGNGKLYLSLTHAAAERLTGRAVPKQDDYGYSSRGRGWIDVPSMRLGNLDIGPTANVPVFDFSETADAPFEGMLGTRFLLATRAAIDFTKDALRLGVAAAGGPDPILLERGYRHVAMNVDTDGLVTIDVFFLALGRTLPVTPSTVSVALTLHRPPFVDKVPMMPAAEPDHSPSGTTPAVYTADGVEYEVAGVTCRDDASIMDFAEYAGRDGTVECYGMLGYDWMKRHRAILDYGNLTLYFIG